MSGHSKWSTIKRKKAAQDAKRGAVFTRISKDLTIAAREGGGDPDMNPTLRLAIKAAKSSNMPASNIDRAIKKGTGNLPGVKYENYIYEGYGPGGVAIMMDIFTDNKKRTVSDIRHIISKNGGNLGETGCVSWMFEKKGNITISKENIEEDQLFEMTLDLGADDFSTDDDELFEITTSPDKFDAVSRGLENAGYKILSGEVSLEPTNTVNVKGAEAKILLNLLALLEDHDDIQKVNSNMDINEVDLRELEQ